MANPLTDVREGVWAALDASAALADFIDSREGTRYRFAESDNLPARLAADDCPALVVTPRLGSIDWETTSSQAVRYHVEVRGYAAATEAAQIEEFAYLVYAALVAGLPDFGVTAVEGVEFAGPAFGFGGAPNGRFAQFTLGVAARIHSAIM